MAGLTLERALLAALALGAAFVGIPATLAPHGFYDSFPFVADWVDLLPPYNEHLTRDVGGLYLAFAALFAWAALRPDRTLVVPVCAVWAAAQALHVLFHVTHLEHFGTVDAVAQTFTLALFAALPLVVLALTRRD